MIATLRAERLHSPRRGAPRPLPTMHCGVFFIALQQFFESNLLTPGWESALLRGLLVYLASVCKCWGSVTGQRGGRGDMPGSCRYLVSADS